jgi:hypothetical protein
MARPNSKAKRLADLDASLKGMFRALAHRPVPDAICSVADQLDEAAPRPAQPRRREI